MSRRRGLTLATTGVLRIAAVKHYATDVIVGAGAGTLVGWLVPCIHRPEKLPVARPPVTERQSLAFSLPLRLGGLAGQGTVCAGFGAESFREASWQWWNGVTAGQETFRQRMQAGNCSIRVRLSPR